MIQQMIEQKRYGYPAGIFHRPSTKKRLQGYGRIGVMYEKLILRMIDVIDKDPELKSLVTDFEDYKDMQVDY